jgi:hypothetical protein
MVEQIGKDNGRAQCTNSHRDNDPRVESADLPSGALSGISDGNPAYSRKRVPAPDIFES